MKKLRLGYFLEDYQTIRKGGREQETGRKEIGEAVRKEKEGERLI